MQLRESVKLTGKRREAIRRSLLLWGRDHFRQFPWRSPGTSPYLHLIAEVLLRKTRADAVVPVYHAFIERFPDFNTLAEAEEEQLAEVLQPIGLFRIRARALRELARQVVRDHGGNLPRDERLLTDLPHCGRYIANAVLCFVYGEPRALVDANIHRFLCRHFGFAPVVEIHKADHLWQFMGDLVPPGHPQEFNYALLDYCAEVCTPRRSRCAEVNLPGLGPCRAETN
jgi:A/G-specific adenine glycosylase